MLLVFSLFVVFLLSMLQVKVSAEPDLTIHNIDTGFDYATIQAAIDSSETLDGHTIIVDDGMYHEHVVVHKNIKLLGSNRSATIIDGNGTGNVVSVTANGSEITGFTIQNGELGMELHYIQSGSVTQNYVSNCSYRGIFLHGCTAIEVSGNTIATTGTAGIELWESYRNVITNNTVKDTSHGIYLLIFSTNNIISNNFVTNNPQGIVLSYNCSDNIIVRNLVNSSLVGGIVTGGAHNNTIYHNNVFQNARQAWIYGESFNFWDNGNEGNFWDDYPGKDLDGDGIGDSPYTIDEDNKDNYPLMGILSCFRVEWEGKDYDVNVISNSTISDLQFEVDYNGEPTKRISFNTTAEDGALGFCRVMIPAALTDYSQLVLVNGEEVNPKVLDISNSAHMYLYFMFKMSTQANSEPVASFVWSPDSPTIQDTINFVDMSHADEGIASLVWSFGDGTSSSEQNPSHQYSDKGTYEVQLTVTDDEHAMDSETKRITIQNLPPVAEFGYSPTNPKKGQNIEFTNISIDPEWKELTFLWDFGDGYTSTFRTPVHEYTEAKEYTVKLTVTDDEGATNSIIKNISISEMPIHEQQWFYISMVIVILVGGGISAFALRKKIVESVHRGNR